MSIEPRDNIFVKRYGHLCFDKKIEKYSQKSFYHAKQFASDAFETAPIGVI